MNTCIFWLKNKLKDIFEWDEEKEEDDTLFCSCDLYKRVYTLSFGLSWLRYDEGDDDHHDENDERSTNKRKST